MAPAGASRAETGPDRVPGAIRARAGQLRVDLIRLRRRPVPSFHAPRWRDAPRGRVLPQVARVFHGAVMSKKGHSHDDHT